MTKDSMTQVNPRLTDKQAARLDVFVAKNKLASKNEGVIEILNIFFNEMESKRESSNVIMLECVLGLILDSASNHDTLKKNAKVAAGLIISEMASQVLDLDERETQRRLGKWHEINPFHLTAHRKGTNVVYKIQHKLGAVFSEFQAEMYTHILEKVGAHVLETKFDDYWYSVEVSWNIPQ